ncbi:hypothetical protein ACLOAV_004541 [Pseudogymnoascus australis]
MATEIQTTMTSLAPKTLNCDLTEECPWDDAETLLTYCFNLEDMDPTIQAASTTLGYDWTEAPPFDCGAEIYATQPVPWYDSNASWNKDKIQDDMNIWGNDNNWGLSWADFSHFVHDEQKSPEELDWPEELRPAEIVRNESELIDGEVIKFIGDSCELVAPTEILSDQPKDSYESQKSTSLLNNDRHLTEGEVKESSNVDVPPKRRKRNRLEGACRSVRLRTRQKTVFYNEKDIWRRRYESKGSVQRS